MDASTHDRSHETTLETRQLEWREAGLHGNTEQPRGNRVEMRSCKEWRGTRHRGQDLRDIVEPIRIRNEGPPSYDRKIMHRLRKRWDQNQGSTCWWNRRKTRTQRIGTCNGTVNHRGRRGTSLEMIWTNVGHAPIADQRIIAWPIAWRTSKAWRARRRNMSFIVAWSSK